MVHLNQRHTGKWMLGEHSSTEYTDVLESHHNLPIVYVAPIYVSVNHAYFKNKYFGKVILLPDLIQLSCTTENMLTLPPKCILIPFCVLIMFILLLSHSNSCFLILYLKYRDIRLTTIHVSYVSCSGEMGEARNIKLFSVYTDVHIKIRKKCRNISHFCS